MTMTDTPPPAYANIPSIASVPVSAAASASASASASSASAPPSSGQYAAIPPGMHSLYTPSTSSSTVSHQPALFPAQPVNSQTRHAAYGPTPLAQNLGGSLPYYDARSAYAVEQAAVRARWRFVEALAWGVGIYFGMGLVTGWLVVDVYQWA